MHNKHIIHEIEGYISNLFLVEYKDRLLILDSGTRVDADTIVDYCTNILKRPFSDIKLSVVTHMHPDHAGGAVTLRKKYGIPVAAYKNSDKWYRGISGFLQHKLDIQMAQMVRKFNEKNLHNIKYSRKIKPDYPLNDNDRLPFFDDWKALYIPGHTLSDIAVYNTHSKILYAGDTVINISGKFNLPIPVFFFSKMKKSYKKLSELETSKILLAHGQNITDRSASEVFLKMKSLVGQPRNYLSRKSHFLSMYAPDLKKAIILKFFRKIFRLKKYK